MVAAAIEVRAAGKDPASDEVTVGEVTADAAVGKPNVTQRKLKISGLLKSLNQSTDMETGTSKTYAVKGANELPFTTISNLFLNPEKITMTSSGHVRMSLCTIGANRPLSKSQGTDIKAASILLSKCEGYGYRRNQRPLEHYPRYGDRGNQPLPLTPGQLYGRNQRGFTPPGQSSNSQHGGYVYYDPPVRVPQTQNRQPSQVPSRANTYRAPNTQIALPSQIRRDSIDTVDRPSAGGELTNSRKRKFTTHGADKTEISGGVNEAAGNHEFNTSKGGGHQQNKFLSKDGMYSGQFANLDAAADALKQTVRPGERVEMAWKTTSKEDPRIKKRRIKELQLVMSLLPLSALLPPVTPEERAEIEAARTARQQEMIGERGQMASDMPMPDLPVRRTAQGRPDQMDVQVNTCGNCKDRSHVVANSHKPRSDGLIHGCAFCNADDHSTWTCGEFPRGDGKRLDQLKELVFKRTNQPPLQGKYWYPLMHSYMQAYPDTEVPGLPWTKEFSQRYHKDSRLQDTLRFQIDNYELDTVDPKTRTWQAAVAHYGDPRQWQTKSKTKQ